MAIWNSANALVTKEGAKLLSQIQAGIGKLTISRIVTGGGYVPPARLYDQTAVSDIRQETKLVNIATDETGSAIEVQVDNSELAESYSLYQLGVYVTHESVEGEVLYWIAQCDENSADVIPLPSELPVALNYSIYVEHSNAGEITILVNPAGSVSLTTFNVFKEEINNKVQAVSDDLNEHKTDVNAHSDYKGATTESAGVRGFVPASPVLESEKDEKFLRSDGTWAEAGKVKTVNGISPSGSGDVDLNYKLFNDITQLGLDKSTITWELLYNALPLNSIIIFGCDGNSVGNTYTPLLDLPSANAYIITATKTKNSTWPMIIQAYMNTSSPSNYHPICAFFHNTAKFSGWIRIPSTVNGIHPDSSGNVEVPLPAPVKLKVW